MGSGAEVVIMQKIWFLWNIHGDQGFCSNIKWRLSCLCCLGELSNYKANVCLFKHEKMSLIGTNYLCSICCAIFNVEGIQDYY